LLFDSPRIENSLGAIEGMSIRRGDLRADDRRLSTTEFVFQRSDNNNSVFLYSDLWVVMIDERATLAALALSIEIQRSYAKEIYLHLGDDVESSIPLSQVATAEELWLRISGKPYEE